MPDRIPLSAPAARRLTVASQHLAGPSVAADIDGIRGVLSTLRCLQLDPVNAVAPSHQLVLWSRLGAYALSDLDRLLWEERRLFEYWAHAASIVLTEDYPIHQATMRRYPVTTSGYGRGVAAWLASNEGLRSHIVERLGENGPTAVDGFEDRADVPWESSGWTAGRNVERMLDILWLQGQVTVAGRRGRARLWDLTERRLPGVAAGGAGAPPLTDHEAVRVAAEHSLRALGVATEADIAQHFIRDRYRGLDLALKELEQAGRVLRVEPEDSISGGKDGKSGKNWYMHADRLPLLETVTSDAWQPRTTLLSPFDNLICDRERTERLWGFAFRNEMYVPKAKRQYGYYLLPILHGDRPIGRLAPRMDRRRKLLRIEGVYAEAGVPGAEAAGEAVAGALSDLAAFAGAESVVFEGPVPQAWREALTNSSVTSVAPRA